MRIQLALDVLDIDKGIELAEKAHENVDIIEAGTPFIKSVGLDSLRKLKERFPEKTLVADLKIMDVGFLETEMAAKAGANIVSVLGAAPDSTVTGCVNAAKEYGLEVMGDLIGVSDKVQRAKELVDLGVDYVLLHTGIDQQNEGVDPLESLKEISESISSKFAIAGGIDDEKIKAIKNLGINVDIVIVGGFITGSIDPKESSFKVKEAAL